MLLLSIHPQYVASILAGLKTVEIRRQRPTRPVEDLVIYATLPQGMLLACAKVVEIVSADAETIWQRFGKGTCLNLENFTKYLEGADAPTALVLGEVTPLQGAMTLDALRELWPGFHPPQGYRYLSPPQIDQVLKSQSGTKRLQQLPKIAPRR